MRRVVHFQRALFVGLLTLGCAATSTRSGSSFPSAAAHAPRSAPFDALAYRIELELRPEEQAIRGECRLSLAALQGRSPLRDMELDLVGLVVERVEDGEGRVLSHRRTEEGLAITLDPPLAPGAVTEVRVLYGGVPETGLWFSGQRPDGSGPTLVFSHGQSRENRGWFPCFDEPGERATSELLLDMPAEWRSLASGERLASTLVGGRRREHWRMDFAHPAYLLGVVAGELAIEEGRAGAVPLLFAAEPHLAEWIAPTFAETDEVLAFLADFTAHPFPFAKYSQAAADNFPWGGMENISATTLTPLLLSDERGQRDVPPFYLIAHEAAHQWFGNLFTCADWSHLWLNEGFATYCTLLYLEATRGVDEFRAELRAAQQAYLSEDVGFARRPIVWNVWKEPDDVFDARPYQGAAVRLHLLRSLLGDEAFRAGVRAYVAESVGRSVVTDDFRRALERSSGRELGPFFAQWFLSPGFPEFALVWEWDEPERVVRLVVEQIQNPTDGTPAVFQVPVEVELRDASGARSVRLELDERRERFELPASERPLYVLFDVHSAIPKLTREEKEAEEWLALARLAEDVNARREAAAALGRFAAATSSPHASEAMAELFARIAVDPSTYVRADAAAALAGAVCAESEEALRRAALEDPAPRVRCAALVSLRAFGPGPALASLAEEAFYGGPSYQVMAAGAALYASADPAGAFEFYAAGLERESAHDALATLLLSGFAELRDARVPAVLERIALDRSYAPSARAAAVAGLARAAHGRRESTSILVPLLEEPSFHLRGAVVRALASLGDAEARRALREYYPRARTAPERRAIEAFGPAGGH
jgi:aminopeptidase N